MAFFLLEIVFVRQFRQGSPRGGVRTGVVIAFTYQPFTGKEQIE